MLAKRNNINTEEADVRATEGGFHRILVAVADCRQASWATQVAGNL